MKGFPTLKARARESDALLATRGAAHAARWSPEGHLRMVSTCNTPHSRTRNFTHARTTPQWFGEDKAKPKDYSGARDAAGIVQFAQQARFRFSPRPPAEGGAAAEQPLLPPSTAVCASHPSTHAACTHTCLSAGDRWIRWCLLPRQGALRCAALPLLLRLHRAAASAPRCRFCRQKGTADAGTHVSKLPCQPGRPAASVSCPLQSVPYLGLHSFLYSDVAVPSVLVFVDSAQPPSWLSSVAVKYKACTRCCCLPAPAWATCARL